MPFLTALPALFSAAGILGDGTILKFLNLAIGIVVAGIDVVGRLKELNTKIQQFVDAGRDPTDDEWISLIDQSDEAHNIIQAEAARRRGTPA